MGTIYPGQNFCLFKEELTKLEEFMVPLTVFNGMVQYVEGLPDFEIHRKMVVSPNEQYDMNAKSYVMPYPYLEPLYSKDKLDKLCYRATEDTLHKIEKEWRQLVFERAAVFAENSLTIERIREIDNDPDIGVIVHITTGTIVLFRYSCIHGIKVAHMHTHIPHFVQLSREQSIEDNPQIGRVWLQFVMDNRYRQMYLFDYIKKDENNPTGEAIIGTVKDHSAMPMNVSELVAEHIINAFNQKKKIILTA